MGSKSRAPGSASPAEGGSDDEREVEIEVGEARNGVEKQHALPALAERVRRDDVDDLALLGAKESRPGHKQSEGRGFPIPPLWGVGTPSRRDLTLANRFPSVKCGAPVRPPGYPFRERGS